MRTLALILLALSPTACMDLGPVDDAADEALTNANFDPTPSWVVWINTPNGSCSAVTLTQKWILTSAHCVADAIAAHGTYAPNRLKVSRANTEGQPYFTYGTQTTYAAAAFYMHPDFVPDSGDVDDDLALIHLDGVGQSSWNPAKLYDDTAAAWQSSGNLVYISAFGQGDDAGESVTCGSNASGTQRRAQFTTTTTGGSKWTRIVSSVNTHHVCPGDSGSPFLFVRNGYDMAFALTKRYADSTIAEGTLIAPKLSWITAQAAAANDSIYCGRYATGGIYYRFCKD